MSADRARLLVLASTYPRWRGDTEPGFVHELSRRLATAFEVTVIAPHYPGAKREETLDAVRVIRFRYAPQALERLAYDGGILANLRTRPWTCLLVPIFIASQILTCTRFLRKCSPDVIHAHWIVPQALIAVLARGLRRTSTPILATAHGGDLFGLRGRAGRLLKSYALRRVDRLSVVSTAMRPFAEQAGIAAKKIAVLPMGVDVAHRFTPTTDVMREERKLLFVGRLVEKKGVSVLLNAFARLREDLPGVRLDIVGEGPERAALEKQLTRLNLVNEVRLLGALPQEQLPEQLRRATALIMPSIEARSGDQEGFGLVQVEAMGCGCPVISSDLPAVRDVIEHGRTGILVPPHDVDALSGAIRELLTQPAFRTRLATTARQFVCERFDWDKIAEAYIGQINYLIEPERSTSSNNLE